MSTAAAPTTSLQENLLCLLAFDTDHCNLVRNALEVSDFTGQIHRALAGKLYEFIDTYHRPPGLGHLADLFDEDRKHMDAEEQELYETVVVGLEALHTYINVEYVLSQLATWVRRQRLMHGVLRAHEAIESGNIDEAETILDSAMRSQISIFQPGIRLLEGLELLRHTERSTDNTIRVGIKELDDRQLGPTRKELHAIIAPPKRGKTWALIHLGQSGLMMRWRVLHISLEMSEQRILQRYLQALFNVTKRDMSDLKRTEFELDSLGRLTDIRFEDMTKRGNIFDPKTQKQIGKKLSNMRFKDNLVIKEFPTGALTLPALRAYLDTLERLHHFTPDLIILDYADLMRIDPRYRREELGTVYVDLRGLAVERNIAVVTASQSNRVGGAARLVEDVHVAEDWSKIATLDLALTYNQTDEEKELNLARLYVSNARNEEGNFAVLIAQSYATGQFCTSSIRMNDRYWAHIKSAAEGTAPHGETDD